MAGSALAAVEGRDAEVGEDAIMELMEAVDSHIPTPTRGVFCFAAVIGVGVRTCVCVLFSERKRLILPKDECREVLLSSTLCCGRC